MADQDMDYAQVTDRERREKRPLQRAMLQLARKKQIEPAKAGEGFITTNTLADSEAEM